MKALKHIGNPTHQQHTARLHAPEVMYDKLASLPEKLMLEVDLGNNLDVIYFDFAKAYDKVPH